LDAHALGAHHSKVLRRKKAVLEEDRLMTLNRRALASALLGMLLFGTCTAFAQKYPNRPIRFVVPYPAGGSVDAVARVFGQGFTAAWNQPVIVDNRPGAGGNIGADMVAKATPDGYTVLITTAGFVISPSIYRTLPFDPVKDFVAVSQLTSTFQILMAHPSVPVHSVKELIALAKAQPGKLNYASTGTGGSLHLAGELFKMMSDTDIVHIPYKGTAPALGALLSGQVQIAFLAVSGTQTHIDAGKLRALAITGLKRSSAMPNIPTVSESGVPNYESVGWQGMFAPAGTPREIVSLLHKEAVKVLAVPKNREFLISIGNEPVGSTPAQFDKKYKADIKQYGALVKKAGIAAN
jgi:tripartite-type tricarboxylate transporter receptor subunit TctC